jgi:hypothetical protein
MSFNGSSSVRIGAHVYLILMLQLSVLILDLFVLGIDISALAQHVFKNGNGFLKILFDGLNFNVHAR